MNKGICAMAAIALAFATTVRAAEDAATKQKRIQHGKHLVDTIGCQDCHSPKLFDGGFPHPDPTKTMSGFSGMKLPPVDKKALTPGYWILMAPDLTAYVGPWGISYAANLTPDEQTGIGLWTEDIFVASIRTGKHMGAGREVLPPMPWNYYLNATDDDLKAIFAYLKSLPPIKNAVPAPVAPQDAAKM
jgi:hypothetical protein